MYAAAHQPLTGAYLHILWVAPGPVRRRLCLYTFKIIIKSQISSSTSSTKSAAVAIPRSLTIPCTPPPRGAGANRIPDEPLAEPTTYAGKSPVSYHLGLPIKLRGGSDSYNSNTNGAHQAPHVNEGGVPEFQNPP